MVKGFLLNLSSPIRCTNSVDKKDVMITHDIEEDVLYSDLEDHKEIAPN